MKYISLIAFVAATALLAACAPDDSGGGAASSSQGGQQRAGTGTTRDSGADTTTADATGEAAAPEPAPFTSVEAVDMRLSWRVIDASLEVEVTAPTTGWVAVGFKPSRAMQDANILIGYVDGSNVVMTDQFGTTMTGHRPDEELGGTSDVDVVSGEERDGSTTIRFTIPLDSGDEFDQPLAAGETLPVILAHGPDDADDTRTYHAARGGIEITL